MIFLFSGIRPVPGDDEGVHLQRDADAGDVCAGFREEGGRFLYFRSLLAKNYLKALSICNME